MKIQLPKTYTQNDPRWKNTVLGNSGTIGDYGCLLTDIAMMCTYYGHEETPASLNSKLKQSGGYQNGNLFVWGAITNLFPDIAYQGQTQTPDALSQAQMDSIKKTLDKGYPVILQIDTIPATAAFDEHWILAIDYDGDDFIVQDPWDGATKRITSWGVLPQELIYAYAYYTGTPTVTLVPSQPAVPPTTPPATSDGGVSVDAATFQQLVNKSTQWDTVASFFNIDKQDAVGGQKVVGSMQQLQSQVSAANRDRDNATASVTQLQTSYNALQSQYANLQMQYNALQQNFLNLQQSAGVASDAQNTIKDLQAQVLQLQKNQTQNSSVPVDNASTKPFWQSKKVMVTGASGLLSAGLIALETMQIKPGDDWQSIGAKLFSAAVGALGISTVASQYVKIQGLIDNTFLSKQ